MEKKKFNILDIVWFSVALIAAILMLILLCQEISLTNDVYQMYKNYPADVIESYYDQIKRCIFEAIAFASSTLTVTLLTIKQVKNFKAAENSND